MGNDRNMELRKKFDAVLEDRWCGIGLLAIGILLAISFEVWIPSPGVSVAVMGSVAAAMAARANAKGIEKANWMLLIAALLVIEILAIRQDRKEHDDALANLLREEVAARTEAKQNFTTIGQGIQETIKKSDEHFDETMERSDKVIAGVDDSIKIQTGADSFAYVAFTPEPAYVQFNQFAAPSGPYFLVSITSHGKYPLRDIHVTMEDPERQMQANFAKVAQAGDTHYEVRYLRPQSSEAPSGDVQLLGVYPFGTKDANDLTIAFSGPNGYWDERLHLRRIDGKWHQALSVVGPTVKQASHPFIWFDADYPEGKALAEKDWQPAKPQVKPHQ